MAGMIPSVLARYSKASTASSSVTGTYSARPDIVKMRVLRPDTRIVKACGNGVDRSNLSVFVLAEIGFHAVEDAKLCPWRWWPPSRSRIDAAARGLTANEAHIFHLQ